MKKSLILLIISALFILAACGEDKHDYRFTWVVPPTLEHNHIFYCSHCGFFAVDNHSGQLINPQTGSLLDEENPWGGHGGPGSWVYDPNLSLFGLLTYGEQRLFPINELFDQSFSVLGLIAVEKIDSTMQTAQYGFEWLDKDAFSGMLAVMHNSRFVTDFIFDAHDPLTDRPGYIAMGKNGSWGLVDQDGNTIVPFAFEHIVPIDTGTVFAKLDGKYGILNIRS